MKQRVISPSGSQHLLDEMVSDVYELYWDLAPRAPMTLFSSNFPLTSGQASRGSLLMEGLRSGDRGLLSLHPVLRVCVWMGVGLCGCLGVRAVGPLCASPPPPPSIVRHWLSH